MTVASQMSQILPVEGRDLEENAVLSFFGAFIFWATPGSAQGLLLTLRSETTPGSLLALCSGLTSGRLRRPYGMPRIEPRWAACKAVALAAVILRWPLRFIFNEHLYFIFF